MEAPSTKEAAPRSVYLCPLCPSTCVYICVHVCTRLESFLWLFWDQLSGSRNNLARTQKPWQLRHEAHFSLSCSPFPHLKDVGAAPCDP